MAAFAFKGSRTETSEQIAMLAAAGKKGKAPAAAKGGRPLWFPSAVAPDYLDGSLPGDRGFDPWGFAKPEELLQYTTGTADITLSKNKDEEYVGKVKEERDVLTGEPLVPWSSAFGLKRLRECELIHGRWAMLFVLGALVGEAVTGVAWQNAGLVEAREGYTYFGFSLPFSGSQITWFEVLTMGFVEIFRNTEMNIEKRVYPGGAFDPLGLASKDAETTFRLKEAEIKHARLAMVAFLGFATAAAKTGAGATTAFSIWAASFGN
uniref:Chloroplast light-harvesting protein CP29 Lhcb4 n=1 Tax=Euglena gracilis TaxID=3039 RepID=A4QPH7_EUGGR|nr:TPA_inf: chloroplast light-harvesting protein CP29 precursor Lhcb4 [Euglena gracilis]